MKTIILSAVLACSTLALQAQVDKTDKKTMDNQVTAITTTTEYRGYSPVVVPSYLQTSFTRDYPAATEVSWQQNGDWYKATYMTNGKYTHAFYHTNGSSFTASLPVLKTHVPDDVISKATQMYGPDIYSIAAAKGNEGETVYNITVIDGGNGSRTEWMSMDGSGIKNPYRMTEVSEVKREHESESLTRSANSVEETGEVHAASGNESNNTNHIGTTTETTNQANNLPRSDNGPSAPESELPVSYEIINNSTTSEDTMYGVFSLTGD